MRKYVGGVLVYFFSLSTVLTLSGRQHPAATKFHVVPTTKNVSFFFSPALAPFLVELRCPVALLRLSLVLCLSPSLFSKFVDMTIDLSLIV